MQWSKEKEQQDKWTNNDLQKTKDQTINYRIQACLSSSGGYREENQIISDYIFTYCYINLSL